MSFSDFLSDEQSDDDMPYADYLTVKAFLEMHFGIEHGREIYDKLTRQARKAADDVGGFPGIVFNADGGEFVSFSKEEEDQFDFFSEGDN